MKIIGITYYDGVENIVLKSDSSLTVNRKPLFAPEWVGDLQALPCYVLRVTRLGRCIAPRFASRYFAAAPFGVGVDFFAADKLREAKLSGKPWTEAIAFEGSLAVGSDCPLPLPDGAEGLQWEIVRNGQPLCRTTMPLGDEQRLCQAVSRVSELLTIRQGDIIYVAAQHTPWQLQTNDLIRCMAGENEILYCKVK